MRLSVHYFDQNENFAAVLPQSGVVEAEPGSSDSSHAWSLLRLDEAVSYEGQNYSHFLLASRWKGEKVGRDDGTSVFILLVPYGASVNDGFSIKDYEHVAWGSANLERT